MQIECRLTHRMQADTGRRYSRTSLVHELQRDALNQAVPVTELLPKSLVVETKLKQGEFLAWIHTSGEWPVESAWGAFRWLGS